MLKSIILKQKSITKCVRFIQVAHQQKESNRINAWQIHSYGEEMQLCQVRYPIITNPSDVIVKIEAASVNPIDTMMKDGYGRTLLKVFRFSDDIVLPLTLGRDFSGVITDKGHNVKEFNVGDKVYGVIPFYKQGSHAQYAIVDQNHIVQQPCGLSHTEAAAVPYAALTAYSALWYTGGLFYKNPKGMKVLILGASGGVGTSAIQMLKAVGAIVFVFGTCSTDAVQLVTSVGIDEVFDYRDPNYIDNVALKGGYDIILDGAKLGHTSIPDTWKYSTYISLNSPFLKNTDDYGLIGGLACSAANLIPSNIFNLPEGKFIKWAYFYPSNTGLKFVDNLIRTNRFAPIIQKTFGFNNLPDAYKATQIGHLRGKIVVDMLHDDCK